MVNLYTIGPKYSNSSYTLVAKGSPQLLAEIPRRMQHTLYAFYKNRETFFKKDISTKSICTNR
jgi:hypothetical protein